MNKSTVLKEAISQFKNSIDSDRLDALFISHLDNDHVNGLPELLNGERKLTVGKIYLPYLDDFERIYIFSEYLSTVDSAQGLSALYEDIIVDPANAFSDFNPESVVFIDGTQESLDSMHVEIHEPEVFDRIKIRDASDSSKYESLHPGCTAISHAEPVEVVSLAGTLVWLLATYYDKRIYGFDIFKNRLAEGLGYSLDDLIERIKSTEFRRELITAEKNKLKSAYTSTPKIGSINSTSLCLFSGHPGFLPSSSRKYKMKYWNCKKKGTYYYPRGRKCGWLGTGDAELQHDLSVAKLLKHYNHLIENIHTLTIPHHGSLSNFNVELLKSIDPHSCIITASGKDGKHPHPDVIVAINDSLSDYSICSLNKNTIFEEYIEITP